MTQLKTKPSLIDALKSAAQKPISADEMQQQRVSFIMGTLKDSSTVTREQVRKVLSQQDGGE